MAGIAEMTDELKKDAEDPNGFYEGEDTEPEKLVVEIPDELLGEDEADENTTPNVGEEGEADEEAEESDDTENSGENSAEEEQPKLSPGLSNLAKSRFGMSDEEIQAFSSDDELIKGMNALPNRDDSGTVKDESKDEGQEEEDDLEAKLKKLEQEDWDPDLVNLFRSTHEELQSVKQQLQQSQAKIAEDEVNHFEEWADTKFTSVVETHGDILGKGKVNEVSKEELGKRMEVIEMMNSIAETRHSAGRDPLSDDALFERALNAVFADRSTELANKKVSSKLRQGSRRMTQRPRRGGKDDLTPEQEAEQAVEEFLAERGITSEDPIDGIPD